MLCWNAAFPIDASLEQRLAELGIAKGNHQKEWQVDEKSIFIYAPPDQILSDWRINQETPPRVEDISKRFNEHREMHSNCIFIAEWRIRTLDKTTIRQILQGQEVQSRDAEIFPIVQPLAGLITIKLIQEQPDILENYQDLELKGLTLGGGADSNYLKRVENSICSDLIAEDWWLVNAHRESSYEESTLNLERMQQVHKEYEKARDDVEALESLLRKQNSLTRQTISKLLKNSGHNDS